MKKIKDLFKKKSFRYGLFGIVAIAVIGTVAYQMHTPKFPEYIDSMEIQISPDGTPLANPPKVETKTSTKTTKKKVSLAKASTKTYTKNLGTKTSTTTKKSTTSTAKITTDTKTEVTTTEKYTKGKKVKEVTTQTKTTVTTTTQETAPTPTPAVSDAKKTSATTASTSSSSSSSSSSGASIRSEASLMDSRILNAFETLGFKIIIDPTFALGEGYFNAKSRSITLTKAKTNHIYHELGHFLAFIAGNADTSSSFKSIYNAEKGQFKGTYKHYAVTTSSEFFAECVREYVLHKKDLKSWCPKAYDAVEAALNKITTAQVASLQKTYGKIWAAYS